MEGKEFIRANITFSFFFFLSIKEDKKLFTFGCVATLTVDT